MATIHIKDLSLRTIIGIEAWERKKAQDIIINITADYDASLAAETDDITHAVDYKAMKQRVIALVEASKFNLVEKLSNEILKIVMSDPKVDQATVTIDKPHALRFAKSVSLTVSAQRSK